MIKIKNIFVKSLAILSLAVILVCFVFTTDIDSNNDNILLPAPPPEPEPIPTVTINLLAVGDNLIHGPIYREAQKRAKGNGFDFGPVYESLEPYLQQADLAFVNQETPLGGTELGLSSYPEFNSPQELGDHLVNIGFNLISHANNHVLDRGQKAFANTLEYWSNQPEVVMAGAYPNAEAAQSPRVIEAKGIRVAFLAYTYATNGMKLPDSNPGKINYIEQEKILADIAQAKEISDIIVVSMHWGIEYQKEPTEEQKQLAQTMANAGVDVIIGHHPHILQKVEELSQPDGSKTIVYYSLGNLVSSQDKPETMLGGMALVAMTFDPNNKSLTIDNSTLIPLVTHYESKYSNTKVIPLPAYTSELAAKHGIKAKSSSFSLDYLKNLAHSTIEPAYLK